MEYLSLKEFALLQKLYRHRGERLIVRPPVKSVSRLIDLGFADFRSCDANGAPKFAGGFLAVSITVSGVNHYRSVIRDNARYWVTTGIAAAALIVSLISLLIAAG